jgi:F0F1-type ATP synthase membrane subunit b/b'
VDRKNCKSQAEADLAAAKAQASVTRQDAKSEAHELKN